jgi:amidohydrolase
LAEHRDTLQGSIKLIFQPAEEHPPGGAIEMVNAGVLDAPSVNGIFALHVFGNIPMNHLYFRPGPIMAGVEDVSITIYGEGGHAAYPHLAIDPILRSAAFISTAQYVVTRDLNPIEPTVISFGKITGGTASNIIPDKVELEGTLRALTADSMTKLRNGLRATLDRLAIPLEHDNKRKKHGYKLSFNAGYPPTVNDSELVNMAVEVLSDRFGQQLNSSCDPVMGSEDFSYYSLKVPGLFIFFGTQNPSRGITAFNHSPRFAIDERVLATGVEVYLHLIKKLLGK